MKSLAVHEGTTSRLQDEFPVWMDVTELNALNKLDEEEGRNVPKWPNPNEIAPPI